LNDSNWGKEEANERLLNCGFGVSARIISGPCHELQMGTKNKKRRYSPEGIVRGEERKMGEWAKNGLERKPTKKSSSDGRSSMEE
jgi:hypothetical protein